MNIDSIKKLNIPKSPGIYKFLGARNKIIYIGKAADLRSRVFSYWRKSAGHTPMKEAMVVKIKKIEWIETDSEIEALLLEANLIKKYKPEFNILMRDDKRYVYLKVSMEDEIPGVFITRKIDKSGKYFGPFTSAEPVKQVLKAIRKIWPYCMERKKKIKPCFYYQINLCSGICAGIVSREEYMERAIKPIIAFLEGKKRKIITNYELRIMSYEKILKKYKDGDEKYDEIKNNIYNLKYQLKNINQVLEHTKILSVGEKYANDAVELAKILGLPKVPNRIEGYDISNIFGQSAVGSMVVFSGGEPDKNEYRKFKIKISAGEANLPVRQAGDVGMLKEVLERRFKRMKDGKGGEEFKENKISSLLPRRHRSGGRVGDGGKWPVPDLIIVDGGKAQLNVAVRILKKNKLAIPVIAISKGLGLRSALAPDKLFFPGEKKPLELPLASPALHLIKRVRDEAHRFAIGYHRKLRGKRMF
jgi:excinuclease ABC subunit C